MRVPTTWYWDQHFHIGETMNPQTLIDLKKEILVLEKLDRKKRGSLRCVTDYQDEIVDSLNRLENHVKELKSQVKALRKLEKERWKEEAQKEKLSLDSTRHRK